MTVDNALQNTPRDDAEPAHMTREFVDATGVAWAALGVDDMVAHGKTGVRLAFRPSGSPHDAPLPSKVTFNSREAADFALRTLGEKELRRRLTLAQAQAGAT
jgi:hypothetical protein